MLRSCQYCGRIHDSKYVCQQKQQAISSRQIKGKTRADRFRWTREWKEKRAEIRERDHVCLVCKLGLYGAMRKYETNDLSVHHIDRIEEAWDNRLDNYNLITLCGMHHEMAEKGEIPKEILRELAEEKEGPPGDAVTIL